MKPLIVLLAASLIAGIAIWLLTGRAGYATAARAGMAAMLCFTAIGHFAYSKGMQLMLPGIMPYKKAIVYATGAAEIFFGAGLLMPALQHTAAWLLIAFFILILPANINAAVKHVDYQKGTYDGNGTGYLWFRVPLQVFFTLWVYACAVKCG